ncbi:MAG: Response regulator receiver protein [Candidatus Gottesmanbacteria bacterium GW2011_GWC2_39_8]|uniref:Response regulator receiver protein n=1 Tax=Candidatus Gottesmanbacteria bacterium GW2011_GWC2_39_8 TaxID=1618450 RepID=A0A0G0PV66_9BACT|nr:MAG: Response regulator receiver protein [Candidatus Gottesmanbacteria bacterium GW2011_GWC2_39_8]
MKKHIFIVDDDTAILEVLKIILEDKGYETTLVSDSEMLLASLNKKVPDLILLDIWLSGLDGQQIVRKLKKTEKVSKIPVIMISASNEGEQLAKESGADDFIAKPFEIDHLVNIVQKNLNKN